MQNDARKPYKDVKNLTDGLRPVHLPMRTKMETWLRIRKRC